MTSAELKSKVEPTIAPLWAPVVEENGTEDKERDGAGVATHWLLSYGW